MSRPRSQKLKAEVAPPVDELTLSVGIIEGTDANSLPFQEFSDQDVNSEKWDLAAQAKDTLPTGFQDTQEVHLPPKVVAAEWKRCSDLFPNVNFVIYTHSTSYPDLVTPNQHLFHNEFYSDFVSAIETLLYIGSTKPYPQAYGTQAYYAAGERPWKPWHHIYSNCKINKGDHSPVYNHAGKYIVRLFWLGAWRKIYLDDLFPVDASKALLLPTLALPKRDIEQVVEPAANPVPKSPKGKSSRSGTPAKKDVIELWPMLLCKALLKLASLSLHMGQIRDFHMITCLTGWTPQKINLKGVPVNDLWNILMAYIPRFEWSDNKEAKTASSKSRPKSGKGKEKSEGSKKGARTAKLGLPVGVENTRDGDRFVLLTCDTTNSKHETLFLTQIRNVPLIKPPPRPELEFWKTFRYEKWAVERGIIPPDITKCNIQTLQIVDPFRRLQLIADTLEAPAADLESVGDRKSEKSSKSSKKGGKASKTAALTPDPSMWIEFSDISSFVSDLTIYFQPRLFQTKTLISDVNFINKANDFVHQVYHGLKECRNEPIYLFLDSIDYKILLINLAEMGNPEIFDKKLEESSITTPPEEQDEELCVEIVLRKTNFPEESKLMSEQNRNEYVTSFIMNHPSTMVLEEYHWDSNVVGAAKATLSTFATKSVLIELKPGRSSFRLWISSHHSYVLQVFSECSATIGSLEDYLFACSTESQLLTNLCYELSSCYGKLVQSFGRPDHAISLRNFYQCYKPLVQLTKQELTLVHRLMLEELFGLIAENCTIPNASSCVRLLFFQLKTFDYVSPYSEEPHLCPDQFYREEQVEYAKLMERAAVKIQAFFKRIYVRALLRKLKEEHKEYHGIFEALKWTYIDVFSSSKRLMFCPALIRKFFEREEMKTLRLKFDIYHDIQSVLNLNTFGGCLIRPDPTWLPICRYQFFVNYHEPVPIKTHLFCNLKHYSVKAFDNDTGQEVRFITNNVTTKAYEPNLRGYTVLCYGWSDDAPRLNWKLILASRKLSRSDVIVVPDIYLYPKNQTLRDQYLPNFDDVICRYTLKVYSDTLLTASLTTSLTGVKISLQLLNKAGKKLQEVQGVRNAIFPIVPLGYDGDETAVLQLQTQPKQDSKSSLTKGYSDISYTKLASKKRHSVESVSRKSSSSTSEQESGQRRHKRRSSAESGVEVEGEPDSAKGSSRSFHQADGRRLSSRRSDRPGSRSSVSGKNKAPGSALNVILEKLPTTYTLQAKVVGNSWPLTAEEWDRVQALREKNYLNLLEDLQPSRKSLNQKKQFNFIEPYWTLHLIYDNEDSMDVERDYSKEEKMKQIKSKWFRDIDRYRRALEIRNDYLENHIIEKVDTPTDKWVRSNDPKDFTKKLLVAEPPETYYTKSVEQIDEDYCKVKNEDDYIFQEADVERALKEFEAEDCVIQEEIEKELEEQQETSDLLNAWFDDIRLDTIEMLTEAKALEREYVTKVLEANNKGKGEKKGKQKRKK